MKKTPEVPAKKPAKKPAVSESMDPGSAPKALSGSTWVETEQAPEPRFVMDGLPENPRIGPLNDFRNYLYLVWQHLQLPDPTPVQYDIADFIQHGPKRSIVMAFRGVGKSYITAAYVTWLWLVDPQLKILVVSASESKAIDFANLVRQLINQMAILQHLKPGKEQRQSILAFDVGPSSASKDPSLRCAGIQGQITGGRADVIVPDDIEIPGNSATVIQREKLGHLVKEFDAILKPVSWARIIYLGTPQTESSLYMTLGGERGYSIRVWPAKYPDKPEKYAGRLAPLVLDSLVSDPMLKGMPTDPKRFDSKELQERALSYGPSGFQLQFMLDPSLSDEERYPLRLRDFIVAGVNREMGPINLVWAADSRNQISDSGFPCVGLAGDRWYRPAFTSDKYEQYQEKIMAIDPSGRGGDETGYCVLYFLKGYVFIAAWGGFAGGYEEGTLERLADIAKQHKVHKVLCEDNFGDGMYAKLLQPVLLRKHRCMIEGVHSSGQKERRICDTLEPPLAAHRLVLDEGVIRSDFSPDNQYKQALFQLTRMTRDRGALKNDDRIDVLAIGMAYFTERMGFDTEKNETLLREELKERQIEAFLRKASPGSPRGENGDFLQMQDDGGWFSDGQGGEGYPELSWWQVQ